MRSLFLCAVTLCSACAAEPRFALVNTKWVESHGEECPDALDFGEGAYAYFNDCYAFGTDGVIETGHFSIANNGDLLLTERDNQAPGNFPDWPWPDSVQTIHIVELTENTLVLRANSYDQAFRKR